MGRTLDRLLGRAGRQSSKLKALLGLTVSRLAVLRNQRHVRFAQGRDDVAQLLQLGHQERAFLRVEQVIKEQNTLDVFVMIEGYCHLLTERAALLEHQKECPEELREAVASLIFASSRCGDLPELQDVRRIFASKFGKEFVAAAVDLRNNCGVHTKMIQKLSTRQPSLQSRIRVTKEIAAERGISIHIDEPSTDTEEVDQNKDKEQSQPTPNSSLSEADRNESMKARHRYKDVASAAQAAFESAAYAAAAARAAVELSRTEWQGKGSDNQSGSNHGSQEWNGNRGEHLVSGSNVEKINPLQSNDSEAEELQATNRRKPMVQLEKSSSSSSSEPTEVPLARPNRSEIKFDTSECKNEKPVSLARTSEQGFQVYGQWNGGLDEDFSLKEEVINLHHPNQKRNMTGYSHISLQEEVDHMGLRSEEEEENPFASYFQGKSHTGNVHQHSEQKLGTQRSYIQRPASMRTRRGS